MQTPELGTIVEHAGKPLGFLLVNPKTRFMAPLRNGQDSTRLEYRCTESDSLDGADRFRVTSRPQNRQSGMLVAMAPSKTSTTRMPEASCKT